LDASTTLNMGIMLASFYAFALIVIFTLIKPWLLPDLREPASARS